MKMTFSMLALVAVLIPASESRAAVPSPDETRLEKSQVCRLDAVRAEALDTIWNDLSRQYLLASLSANEEPERFRQVKRDVALKVANMRRRFGEACVLDIL